ncbi:unnamed protein product [Hymenolepis diminuta]|uniref:TPR_REGION domain-containing protein n=1 Tax=Hymenolepis diminuta TaxID=6216 RepID=A0A0R3SRL1_HYMDI|nr:unnamed protein product [Hymenolepis diminuta]
MIALGKLADALRSYAKSLNILPSNPASRNSSGLSLLNKIHLQSSTTPEGGGEDKEETTPTTTITNNPATSEAASTNTTSTANAPSPEPSSPAPNLPQSTNSGVPLPPPQMSRSSLEVGEAFAPPPPPVLPGGQKFVVSRLFLFDRMLLVTEEVKAKRKGTSADAFAQSTYQFRAAVNVNKMKFEPHWFMCSLTSESAPIGPAGPGTGETPTPAPGTPAAFAAAVSAGGPGSSATESTDDQCAGSDWAAVRAALDFAASDDLRFALWDQTPGRDVIYIIDPQTVATRSAWVVHLRDIQRMQQQLLMALEDPTRFAAAEKEWGEKL